MTIETTTSASREDSAPGVAVDSSTMRLVEGGTTSTEVATSDVIKPHTFSMVTC